jgi:integrase/recombinase XerD
MRLKVTDFHDLGQYSYVDVDGKGHKKRSVPYAKETKGTVQIYLGWRESILRGRKTEYFIIGPRSIDLKRDNAERINKEIVRKTGVKWTYHTLRRTWGRTAWESGVPLETIRFLLGHEDTKTTERYIGVNLFHGQKAMGIIDDYRSSKFNTRENNQGE